MNSQLPVLLAAVLALAVPAISPAATQAATSATVPTKVAATKDALRDLWMGHIFWIRNVVEALLAGNTNQAKASEQQVVANAQALPDALATGMAKQFPETFR